MRHLPVLVAASLLATPALSADLYRKAPVQEAAPFSWTGFYAGAHVGGGWVSETQTFLGTNGGGLDPVGTNYNTDRSSVLGGVNAGYNYQVGNFVAGAAGDFSWTNAKGISTTNSIAFPGFVITSTGRTDWYATVTARAGVAFNTLLVYAKAGYGWSKQAYDGRADGFASIVYSPFTDIRGGLVLGVGGEWAFTKNVSVFAEYNNMNFGTKTYNFTDTTGTVLTTYSAKTTANVVKAGVNYHF